MDVGNFAVDQSTGHDVRRGTNRARQPEDLMALGVAPPAPCDSLADYGLREVGHGSSSAFKHDTMAADEGNRGSRGHFVIDVSRRWFWRSCPASSKRGLGRAYLSRQVLSVKSERRDGIDARGTAGRDGRGEHRGPGE